MLRDLDRFDEHVHAEVLPVQVEFDEPVPRGIAHAQLGRQAVGDGVLHERLVGEVAHERPVLVFGHPEDFLLLQEFNLVAFLGHRLPRGVAAAPDGHLHHAALGLAFAPNLELRGNLVFAVLYLAQVFRLDDDSREARVRVFAVVDGEVVGVAAAVVPGAFAVATAGEYGGKRNRRDEHRAARGCDGPHGGGMGLWLLCRHELNLVNLLKR